MGNNTHLFNVNNFWENINKLDECKCWIWKSATDIGGYGRIWFEGRDCKAHRIAYTITNGPIPEGMKVLHSCDNPPCCNPHHLRVGTSKENTADMFERNRANPGHVPGVSNGRAKLTEFQVIEIRRRISEGETMYALAKEYLLHRSTIRNIVIGKLWKHLPLA